jgi:AraC-like DNA-binding protein
VQDDDTTSRGVSDSDASRLAARHVNARMVSALWPFDHELWERWHAPRHAARFAHRAIQNIWVLQHNMDIPAPVSSALVAVLREALDGMALPDEAQAWLTLLDAQQCLLRHDAARCKQLLAPLLAGQHTPPEAWVAALVVAFKAAMLQAMGHDKAVEDTPQARQGRRVHAMSELRDWMDGGKRHMSACAPRAQAQAMRIGMIANAVAGLPIEQGAWLQLATQMGRPIADIDRALSELAAAWLFIAEHRRERATLALQTAQSTSEAIGWRWGLLFATYELDCLRHPNDAHEARLQRLPAGLTHRAAWDEAKPMPPQSHVSSSAERFALAVQHVQAHIGRRISLQELATLCQVSQRTLTQDFHEGAGQPPLAYINAMKVRQGHALLEAGHSLKQAASAVGYESVLGFSKAYFKAYGKAPTERPR